MSHDLLLYVLLPAWGICCMGVLYDALVKKPVHRTNGTQATRVTRNTNPSK